jgi:signal transduction histidine kinase
MEQELVKTRNTFKEWRIWIGLFILPLLFYPKALTSTWISSSDVHALLEFWASITALGAACIILIHFFSTGKRFFLMISLGFTLQGTEDLVHAIYAFSRIWPTEQIGIINFVPGTYVAGRLILIICIFLAFFMHKATVLARDRGRQAVIYNSIGFLMAIMGTVIIVNSQLPRFILPGQIISRPVDFVAAIMYLTAFLLFVKLYRDEEYHTPFMWSMIASIIFGFVAQVYMVHSQQLYDAQFDISHVVKIISYVFPVFGIAVGTFDMYRKEEKLKKDLTNSIEREKIFAAKGAALEVERKRAGELAKLKDGLEVKVAERTKELVERAKKSDKSRKAMLYMVEDLNKTTDELRSTQERLGRTEKLAIIGKLAGIVSHELRNPLSVIRNSIYFLNMRLGKGTDEKIKKHLDILREEIDTSDKIITDILNFVSIKTFSKTDVNINDVIKETLLDVVVSKNINVQTDFGKNLPIVSVDNSQIKLVFLNLIMNANQAMSTGGVLKIITTTADKFVAVHVSDTGCGIESRNLNKIFEPLYSSKAKGIGLGLSTCSTIIDAHRGMIEVESEVNKGTTFVVKLPISEK